MWMWMYTGIKVFLTFFRKPIHDFLSNFYWHFLSISNRFWDIWLQSFQRLTLTFRGHLRSKIFPPFESPYMNSYLTSIDTFSLSCPVFEIFDFKASCLNVNVNVHWNKSVPHFFLKAHAWLPIQLLLTLSLYLKPFLRYLTSKFPGIDLDLSEVTWGQKYFHHSKAHTWIPI